MPLDLYRVGVSYRLEHGENQHEEEEDGSAAFTRRIGGESA